MSRPLLLLAAPSRESQDKARHFAAAAQQLDLPSRILVSDRADRILEMAGDEPCRFALPCSDAHAVAAAMLNDRDGTGGMSAALTAQLVDKSTGIPLLSRLLGLPVLPQCLPHSIDDILAWEYDGPIIVKPTRSSGSWSPRPWGYRQFECKQSLVSYLIQENLINTFFHEQCYPGSLGAALLQAFANNPQIVFGLLLLTPQQSVLMINGDLYFEPVPHSKYGRRWQRVLLYPRPLSSFQVGLDDFAQNNHLDLGCRSVIFVQALESSNNYHLIDIQTRVGSSWDWMASVADPSAHRRLLSALLYDTPLEATLPAPAVAIDLVHGDPYRRIRSIDHPPLPPHILPLRLTPESCGTAVDGFDRSSSAPAFVTLADDVAACIAKADAFRAGISVHYVADVAS